ncbi:MAG: NUDIX hydrolase [Rhodospirillales bacterium]|jgi:ADP-ribose pyrophosphatase YjhB (NUDIX family)|nr:NUDIX hydrolase [Rhodospirillales bacterium]
MSIDPASEALRNYPDHPYVGVGVVVWKDDSFLLVTRGKPPRLGEWSIPGGGQELGETVRETAAREIREETGLEIEVGHILDVLDGIRHDDAGRVSRHMVLIDFMAEWKAGVATPGSDAPKVGWFTLDDLPELKLWGETERIIRMSAGLRG